MLINCVAYQNGSKLADIPVAEISDYISRPGCFVWVALLDAIRNDKPHNEVKRGVEASVVCNMGRMSTHTGQEITFDEMLNHEHEYCPDADKLTMDSPPPLLSDKDGKYPVPTPGLKKGKNWQEWYV